MEPEEYIKTVEEDQTENLESDLVEPVPISSTEAEAREEKKMARISISGFLQKDPVPQPALQQLPQVEEKPAEPEEEVKEEKKAVRQPGEPMKPLRDYPKGSHRFGTLRFLDSSIRAQRPQDIVGKPDMVSLDEWWAVHATLFYNHASVLYGKVAEDCQRSSFCDRMRGGRQAEYLFSDGRGKNKAPRSAAARFYIGHLFDWLESVLDDVHFYPAKDFASYPPDFEKAFRVYIKRIFRIFAHLNYAHRADLKSKSPNGEDYEKKLDFILMHLLFFIKQFRLMDKREFDVLKKRNEIYLKQVGLFESSKKKRKEREEKQ